MNFMYALAHVDVKPTNLRIRVWHCFNGSATIKKKRKRKERREKAKCRISDAGTNFESSGTFAFGRTDLFSLLFPSAERQCAASSDVNMCIHTPRAYVTCEQTNAQSGRRRRKKKGEANTTILNLKVFRCSHSLSLPFSSVQMRHLAARHVFQQSNVQEFFFSLHFFFVLLSALLVSHLVKYLP